MDVSEKSLEHTIEENLIGSSSPVFTSGEPIVGESAVPYGPTVPGGYLKRSPESYDRDLSLIPKDVVDFVLATQPREWGRLKQHHGGEVKERFLKRLAREIERRGALDVLRTGIKDSGQLHYSDLPAPGAPRQAGKNEKSLDLVLFCETAWAIERGHASIRKLRSCRERLSAW